MVIKRILSNQIPQSVEGYQTHHILCHSQYAKEIIIEVNS